MRGSVLIMMPDADRRTSIVRALAECGLVALEMPDTAHAMAALGRADFDAMVCAETRPLTLKGFCLLARKRHPAAPLFVILDPDRLAGTPMPHAGVGEMLLDADIHPTGVAQRVMAALNTPLTTPFDVPTTTVVWETLDAAIEERHQPAYSASPARVVPAPSQVVHTAPVAPVARAPAASPKAETQALLSPAAAAPAVLAPPLRKLANAPAVLTAELEELPGAALLTAVMTQALTGALVVEDGPAAGVIYFFRGDPVALEELGGDQALFTQLKAAGLVPQFSGPPDVPDGELAGALLEQGVLNATALQGYLVRALRDRISALVLQDKGGCRFLEDTEFLQVLPLNRLNMLAVLINVVAQSLGGPALDALAQKLAPHTVVAGPALAAVADRLRTVLPDVDLPSLLSVPKPVATVLASFNREPRPAAAVLESLRRARLVSVVSVVTGASVSSPGVSLKVSVPRATAKQDGFMDLPNTEVTDVTQALSKAHEAARQEVLGLYMRIKPLVSPHQVLGVPLSASAAQIEQAWSALKQKLDPARLPAGPHLEVLLSHLRELQQKLDAAYQTLSMREQHAGERMRPANASTPRAAAHAGTPRPIPPGLPGGPPPALAGVLQKGPTVSAGAGVRALPPLRPRRAGTPSPAPPRIPTPPAPSPRPPPPLPSARPPASGPPLTPAAPEVPVVLKVGGVLGASSLPVPADDAAPMLLDLSATMRMEPGGSAAVAGLTARAGPLWVWSARLPVLGGLERQVLMGLQGRLLDMVAPASCSGCGSSGEVRVVRQHLAAVGAGRELTCIRCGRAARGLLAERQLRAATNWLVDVAPPAVAAWRDARMAQDPAPAAAPVARTPGPPAGTIGSYELLRPLGRGGMAEVWLAHQHGPGGFIRPVAIKRVLGEMAAEQELMNMFMDEARHAARISHPHVAHIYELGHHEGQPYIAMEYVRGWDLRTVLDAVVDAGGKVPTEVAARVGADICSGLHAAHVAMDPKGRPLGMVHRDVSPQNILLGVDGHVKIVDFGIARALDSSTHTRPGVAKGKPSYMAPEQVVPDADGGVDSRTDVFAVGIVLHEMLTGAPLFRSDTTPATLAAVLRAPIPLIRPLRSEVSAELERAVLKALSRERSGRPPSAQAMQLLLEGALFTGGRFITAAHLAEWLDGLVRSGTLHPLGDDAPVVHHGAATSMERRKPS